MPQLLPEFWAFARTNIWLSVHDQGNVQFGKTRIMQQVASLPVAGATPGLTALA